MWKSDGSLKNSFVSLTNVTGGKELDVKSGMLHPDRLHHEQEVNSKEDPSVQPNVY